MNIKITEQEAEFLFDRETTRHLIGSHLYGTATDKSDTDYLVCYDYEFYSNKYYPNFHQFQLDRDNIQFIFTSEYQFWKNLYSGDSTINADVVMFSDIFGISDKDKLLVLRTYKIIKAFIGFAKRDLKQAKGNLYYKKFAHAQRGLYCAEKLLNNEIPKVKEWLNITTTIKELTEKEIELRRKCNELFEKKELTLYSIDTKLITPENSLEQKMIEANNIIEFKY